MTTAKLGGKPSRGTSADGRLSRNQGTKTTTGKSTTKTSTGKTTARGK